jgi:hypothetical protein
MLRSGLLGPDRLPAEVLALSSERTGVDGTAQVRTLRVLAVLGHVAVARLLIVVRQHLNELALDIISASHFAIDIADTLAHQDIAILRRTSYSSRSTSEIWP